DAARDGDIDMVLDTACLGAIADAKVGVPLVRAKRDKNDLSAAFNRETRHLREFDVIADLDCNLALVGVEHFDGLAAFDSPPLPLGRRNVQLVLLAERAVAAE